MAGCTCENWSLQDLSSALQDMHKDNKRIVVPMFQRGSGRWGKEQEKTFIDSLIKGYPVGTMLFYETFEDAKRTYILVDGLQRGNCIRKYMTNPTEFFYDDNVSDEFCSEILKIIRHESSENYSIIRNMLTCYIKEQKTFKNLQYYSVAKQISDKFDAGYEPIEQLIDTIKNFFEERQNLYDKISNTLIPVIIYTGDESNLPDIFDRINSKGTPLDQYEVYAAAWPVNEKYVIDNSEVIEHVMKKYDSLVENGYLVHGYNREEMRSTRKVNAFEYLFGLGKYLVGKYEILGFEKNLADDTVNPIAFELINACLNDSNKIRILYKNLQTLNPNVLERAIYKAIDFVRDAISIVTKFKGNSRNENKILHSKYQILSMISTTFKEMYTNGDYTRFADDWQTKKTIIAKNLVHYYVYDIITDYWDEGGTSKIHAAAKPNRYMSEISGRTWMVALDGFFERSMAREETKKVANPKNEDYVILNCIYLRLFSAMDQLSIEKFDVEHIAPKEQMRKLINDCGGEGLSVSCIANLCYLPEYVNRSKKDKNFYQDKKYLLHVSLNEVESKYSFTEEEDLEWMDMPYEKGDFPVLKEYYTDYCRKRFDKIKSLFCEALEIKYEQSEDNVIEISQVVVVPTSKPNQSKKIKFSDRCVMKLAKSQNSELIKTGRNTYTTIDGKKGFVITTSKLYKQGKREKFWFAYRRNPLKDLKNCEEKYVVYGCKDEKTLVMFPVSFIEDHLDNINYSKDDDDIITHWHIVFFKDDDNTISWMMSKPCIREIDISNYLIQ